VQAKVASDRTRWSGFERRMLMRLVSEVEGGGDKPENVYSVVRSTTWRVRGKSNTVQHVRLQACIS
jgi:hypothetical protein